MFMKVMHYYTYPENSGGPLTYIKNIMESEYFSQVEFSVCYQEKPASQIRKADLKRIICEIEAFSPDILHVHGVQSEGFIGVYTGRKAKVPKILMAVHGLQIDAQNISKQKKYVFKYLIEPYALRHSDAVYCVCDEMTNREFIKKHSNNLLPTIHNFITDDFTDSKSDDMDFSFADEKVVVATVGRVSLDKGMKELEECIISDMDSKVQYWIIGNGDYEDDMKKNLSEYIEKGRVIFWGQQKNVKSFLNRADVFLFLSHHENLSLALLEAASQKCCCIATEVGGNKEVINDGDDGLLVQSMDSEKALAALRSVTENAQNRKQMGERIFAKLQSDFSEKSFSEKLLSVYINLYYKERGCNDSVEQ